MNDQIYDVLCIGNAIVDVFASVEDDFLIRHGVAKGAMNLIDEGRASALYAAMGPGTLMSGGSAANTAVGAAALKARAAFIGKVREDEIGRIFAHDIRATGTHFATPMAVDGPATALSYILVTPDGQRSMNTYLGACQNLTVADVDEHLVRSAAVTYLEGYLWDPPAAKAAFVQAAGIAHAAGRQVALTLSDSFCVDRYRTEFLGLIRSKTVDIVFANESELHALYETSDFATALNALREDCTLGSVTLGAAGAVVVHRNGTETVRATPIERLVDSTGAGDLFAAGFLAGFTRGFEAADCARLGTLAAAEIIQHVGARPTADLAALAAESGFAI
jgi:sugar/nucleoside kinase (ribokinase family)